MGFPARLGRGFPRASPGFSPRFPPGHPRRLSSPFRVGFDALKGLSQPECFSKVTFWAGIVRFYHGKSAIPAGVTCLRSIPDTEGKGSKAGLRILSSVWEVPKFRLGFCQPGSTRRWEQREIPDPKPSYRLDVGCSALPRDSGGLPNHGR